MSTASGRAAAEGCLRAALDCLRRGDLGPDLLPEDSSLRRLLSREGLRGVLGADARGLPGLPEDLPALLRDPVFARLLAEALPSMVGAAELTLTRVAERGRSEGREMDAATRLGVAARIAQETLAREVAVLGPVFVGRLREDRRLREEAEAQRCRSQHRCRRLSSAPRTLSAGEGGDVSADAGLRGTTVVMRGSCSLSRDRGGRRGREERQRRSAPALCGTRLRGGEGQACQGNFTLYRGITSNLGDDSHRC